MSKKQAEKTTKAQAEKDAKRRAKRDLQTQQNAIGRAGGCLKDRGDRERNRDHPVPEASTTEAKSDRSPAGMTDQITGG